MSDDKKLEAKLFEALDCTFELFEKEHGRLNDESNFDLFGKHLEDTVHNFNKTNETNFNPEEITQKQSEQPYLLDEFASYMEEALENYNNL